MRPFLPHPPARRAPTSRAATRRAPRQATAGERARWPRSFLAVDVETTGFSARNDRVLELALVRFEAGRPKAPVCLRFDPGKRIPRIVTSLTGIAAADVVGQPRFAAVAARVLSFLASARCLVAYNAPFDRGFLDAELARAGLRLPDVPWIDVLAVARAMEPRAGSFSLASVCARHGVSGFSAHRADEDARAAGELWVRLAAQADPRMLTRYLPRRPAAHDDTPLLDRARARALALFD